MFEDVVHANCTSDAMCSASRIQVPAPHDSRSGRQQYLQLPDTTQVMMQEPMFTPRHAEGTSGMSL